MKNTVNQGLQSELSENAVKFNELTVANKRKYIKDQFGTVKGTTGFFDYYIHQSIADTKTVEGITSFISVYGGSDGSNSDYANTLWLIDGDMIYSSGSIEYHDTRKRINRQNDHMVTVQSLIKNGDNQFEIVVTMGDGSERKFLLNKGSEMQFDSQLISQLHVPKKLDLTIEKLQSPLADLLDSSQETSNDVMKDLYYFAFRDWSREMKKQAVNLVLEKKVILDDNDLKALVMKTIEYEKNDEKFDWALNIYQHIGDKIIKGIMADMMLDTIVQKRVHQVGDDSWSKWSKYGPNSSGNVAILTQLMQNSTRGETHWKSKIYEHFSPEAEQLGTNLDEYSIEWLNMFCDQPKQRFIDKYETHKVEILICCLGYTDPVKKLNQDLDMWGTLIDKTRNEQIDNLNQKDVIESLKTRFETYRRGDGEYWFLPLKQLFILCDAGYITKEASQMYAETYVSNASKIKRNSSYEGNDIAGLLKKYNLTLPDRKIVQLLQSDNMTERAKSLGLSDDRVIQLFMDQRKNEGYDDSVGKFIRKYQLAKEDFLPLLSKMYQQYDKSVVNDLEHLEKKSDITPEEINVYFPSKVVDDRIAEFMQDGPSDSKLRINYLRFASKDCLQDYIQKKLLDGDYQKDLNLRNNYRYLPTFDKDRGHNLFTELLKKDDQGVMLHHFLVYFRDLVNKIDIQNYLIKLYKNGDEGKLKDTAKLVGLWEEYREKKLAQDNAKKGNLGQYGSDLDSMVEKGILDKSFYANRIKNLLVQGAIGEALKVSQKHQIGITKKLLENAMVTVETKKQVEKRKQEIEQAKIDSNKKLLRNSQKNITNPTTNSQIDCQFLFDNSGRPQKYIFTTNESDSLMQFISTDDGAHASMMGQFGTGKCVGGGWIKVDEINHTITLYDESGSYGRVKSEYVDVMKSIVAGYSPGYTITYI